AVFFANAGPGEVNDSKMIVHPKKYIVAVFAACERFNGFAEYRMNGSDLSVELLDQGSGLSRRDRHPRLLELGQVHVSLHPCPAAPPTLRSASRRCVGSPQW